MALKKKQTMRSKIKKQPHWKELALLLSKKRQLNVVLRREIIPPEVAVASTSEDFSSRLNSENCQEEDNVASDEENIIRIKQEIVTPEPSSGLPPESNDQGSTSAICSGKHNFRKQPSGSNDSDETYNVSINDFQSLLVAATQRSDIRLSIENTYFNLSSIDDQIRTEHSEPNDLHSQRLEQNNIVMIATKNKKKQTNQKRKAEKNTLRSTKNDQKSVKQNRNHNSTKINENKAQENNLQSKSILKSSTNETRKKEKQYVPKKKILRGRLRNKYKIQDEILENEFDQNRKNCAVTKFYTKTRGKPAKKKICEIEELPQDKDQRKQNQTEKKNQQDFSISNCKITKGLRSNNARMQVSSAVNVDDTNLNGDADNNTNADVMPVNKTGELERHTKEASEECVMITKKKKTKPEPKSIAYELRSLRRRIIGVSKSQKQIQAALQSSNDRFDLFGKTIAACLRELPRYESQSLEIKLMDVLLEEKRNFITLTPQPMYSNGHNGQ